MKWPKRKRHCSGEQLVSYLDGELAEREESYVRSHTNTCVECRSRLRDFEVQALEFASLLELDKGLGHPATSRALHSFLRTEPQIAMEPDAASGPPASRFGFPAAALAAVAAAVIVIAGVHWNRLEEAGSGSDAVTLLARAKKAEMPAGGEGTHQVFRLTVDDGAGASLRSQMRLEIWSDPSPERFSAELSDDEGRLVRAVWKPRSDRQYSYSQQVGEVRYLKSRRVDHSFLDGLVCCATDCRPSEARILEWVLSRAQYPILIARDFSAFASGGADVVSVHRAPANGETGLLVADRLINGCTARMTLELNLRTYRPRRAILEVGDGKGSVVVQFLVERNEAVPHAQLIPAVFEPNPSLTMSARVRRPEPTPPINPLRNMLPEQEVSRPSVEPDLAELRLRLALHDSGACRGNPIQILSRSDGTMVIEGVAASMEQLQRWQSTVAAVQVPNTWQVDLRYAEVAPTEIAKLAASTSTAEARRPPIEELLRSHFSKMEHPDSVDLSEQTLGFINDVLSHLYAAHVEAWALRRLAERYPDPSELREPAKILLGRMVREHLQELSRIVEVLGRDLNTISGADDNWIPLQLEPDFDTQWNAEILSLFAAVDSVHANTLVLFTSTITNSPGQVSARDVEPERPLVEAIRDIVLRLEDLSSNVSSIARRVEAELMATGSFGKPAIRTASAERQ